jgi:hypothetical protein
MISFGSVIYGMTNLTRKAVSKIRKKTYVLRPLNCQHYLENIDTKNTIVDYQQRAEMTMRPFLPTKTKAKQLLILTEVQLILKLLMNKLMKYVRM